MKLPIIQSLWIGDDLSNLEKLCVQSFLDNGHEFHLYTYSDIGGIPAGAVVKDGNEILPESDIFQYRTGSYAGFADWFRYKLLLERGGWWVDMDLVCFRPFDFQQKLIVEHCPDGLYTNTPLYAEPGNLLMAEMERECREHKNREGARFGTVGGPRPITRGIVRLGLQKYGVSALHFELCDWVNACNKTYANLLNNLPSYCHSAHFGNEHIRKNPLMTKNAIYDKESLFEQLKAKHGIENLPTAKRVTSEDIASMLLEHDAKQQKRVAKRRFIVPVALAILAASVVGNVIGWIL